MDKATADRICGLAIALYSGDAAAMAAARADLEAVLAMPFETLYSFLADTIPKKTDPYTLSLLAIIINKMYIEPDTPTPPVKDQAVAVCNAYFELLFTQESFDNAQSVYKVCSILSSLCLKYWDISAIKDLVLQTYSLLVSSPIVKLKALQFYSEFIKDFSFMAMYNNFEVVASFRKTVVIKLLEASFKILSDYYDVLMANPEDVIARELISLSLSVIPDCMEFGTDIGVDGDRTISLNSQTLDNIIFKNDDPTYIVVALFDLYESFISMPEISSRCLRIVVSLCSLTTISVEYDKYIVNRDSILAKMTNLLKSLRGFEHEENVGQVIHFIKKIPRPFAAPSDLLQFPTLTEFITAMQMFSSRVLMSDSDFETKAAICEFWGKLNNSIGDQSNYPTGPRSYSSYGMGDAGMDVCSYADIANCRCEAIKAAVTSLLEPLITTLCRYIYSCYSDSSPVDTSDGGLREDNRLKAICETKNSYVNHLITITKTSKEAKDCLFNIFMSSTMKLFEMLANLGPSNSNNPEMVDSIMVSFIQFSVLFNILTLAVLGNLVSISRSMELEDYAKIIAIFICILRDISQSSIFRPVLDLVYGRPSSKTIPQRIFFNMVHRILMTASSNIISVNGYNKKIIDYLFITPGKILTFDEAMVSNNAAAGNGSVLSPAEIRKNMDIAVTFNSDTLRLLLKLDSRIRLITHPDADIIPFYKSATNNLFENAFNLLLFHLSKEAQAELSINRDCFPRSNETLKNLIFMSTNTQFANKAGGFEDVMPMVRAKIPQICSFIKNGTNSKVISRTHKFVTSIIIHTSKNVGLSAHLMDFHSQYYQLFKSIPQAISQITIREVSGVIYFVKGLTGVTKTLDNEYLQMPLIKFVSFYVDSLAVIAESLANGIHGTHSIEYILLRDILSFVSVLLKTNLDNITTQLTTDINIVNNIRLLLRGLVRIISSLAAGLRKALAEGEKELKAIGMVRGSDRNSSEMFGRLVTGYESFEHPVRKLMSLGIAILGCTQFLGFDSAVEQVIVNILEISNMVPVFIYRRKPDLMGKRVELLSSIGMLCPTIIARYPQDGFNKLWDFCANVLFDSPNNTVMIANFVARLLRMVTVNKTISSCSTEFEKTKLYIELNDAVAFDTLEQVGGIYQLFRSAVPSFREVLAGVLEAVFAGGTKTERAELYPIILYSLGIATGEEFEAVLCSVLERWVAPSSLHSVLKTIMGHFAGVQPTKGSEKGFAEIISNVKTLLSSFHYQ